MLNFKDDLLIGLFTFTLCNPCIRCKGDLVASALLIYAVYNTINHIRFHDRVPRTEVIQALKQYEGSLVFISHDVHFIRKLAESTWHISDGKVTRYSGGYDYYLEKSGLLDDEKGGITA